VDARNSLDAVDKMLRAGAMGCRNIENRCACEEARFDLNPIPQEQLRNLVGLCMREVEEQAAHSRFLPAVSPRWTAAAK